MFMKEKSIVYISFAGLILLVLAVIYHLNVLFPVFADDIGFTFVSEIGKGLTRKVSNIYDIFETQYSQYHVWGGRCVVHFILQSLLLLGDGVANVLNSIAYLALSLLIYVFINKGNEVKPLLFLLINMVLVFTLPTFSETVLWITGSVNYTWGTLIILFFIYPFYTYFLNGKVNNSWIRSIGMFFAGIIAGWTNENTAFSMILMIIALLVYLKITKKEIPVWIITGLIGACIGYLIMILAPGNYIRSAGVSHNLGLDEVSAFKLFKIRLYNLLQGGLASILLYLAIFILFAFFYWKNKSQLQGDYRKPLYASLAFMSASIISYCVLFPTPTFPGRAMFGVVIYALIAIGILFANIPNKNTLVKVVKILTVLSVCVLFFFAFNREYTELVKFSDISKVRENLIQEQKEKGILDIVFTEKETMLPDKEVLTTDSLNFYNVYFAKYYNINSIRLEKSPHW